MLYVSIEAGNHGASGPALISVIYPQIESFSVRPVEGNTAIFAGSITFFSRDLREITFLDTPDQFDYDSACTMILNLKATALTAAVELIDHLGKDCV